MSENDIGKKMYERRKQLGLSLEAVGDAVGVGKSTVRKWENGMIKNMGRDKIAALAAVLHLDPVEFVPGPEGFKTLKVEAPVQKKNALDILLEAVQRGDSIQIYGMGSKLKAPVSVEIDQRLKSMMKLWEVSTPSTQDTVIEFMKAANKTNKKE